MYCPVKDPPAIEKDKETGAVVIYPERCGNCCLECMKCPWQIPRFKTKGEKIYRQAFKCRLCLDRLKKKDRKSGQNLTVDAIPACAKACPQGAIWFGSKEQINQLTDTRLEITSKRFPKASIYPAKDYGVIWILTEPLKVYGLE
jgi:Fe-S-cluster-containing dehydrogenase component